MTKTDVMEAVKAEANKIVKTDAIANTLADLKSRWADEKEYEDFNDYIDVMKEVVEVNGYHFIKLNKRFELTLGGEHGKYQMKNKLGSTELTFIRK